MGEADDNPGVIAPPPLIALATLLLGLGLDSAAASRSSASQPQRITWSSRGPHLADAQPVLKEEVKFDRSRVVSIDWSTYPILIFSEVPKLDIELIDRPNEPPMGAGEAACTPVGAALANAVFDATRVRMRTVPFTQQNIDAAWGKSS
jgi:hypothetical protein